MPSLPLTGIRALEVGGYISMPYAAATLAALGADVVKVERPVTGDDFRRGMGDRSPYFRQYNSGKQSVAVDLKRIEGIAAVRALLPSCDVVMENMRPGKMAALGLGPDDLAKIRPDLVYASITGFGAGGPLAQRPAYDTIGQAFGGLYTVLGDAGSPDLSGTCLADLITGVTITTGILAALVGRGSSSAEVRLVETSLMEAVSTLTVDALTQYFESGLREPSRQSRHPQAQSFVLKTASGEDIAVHLSSSQRFWRSFAEAMRRTDLLDDSRFVTYRDRERNYFELADIVEREFLTKSAADWEKTLANCDVPYAPVLTMSGYLNHPQTEWLDLVHPEQDGVALLRPPFRFDGERPARDQRVPGVGEHTRKIMSEVYDQRTIDALVADGVLYTGD